MLRWLVAIGVAGVLAALARRYTSLVDVEGQSMAPALMPGDWLIVESLSFRRRPPRAGEVVVAPDPWHPDRELVKRAYPDDAGGYQLLGDAPAASTDSRVFGSIPAEFVRWRAAFRYWPPSRIGVVRAR
ncbi:MAG: nickel-type superoxide dismutase maturation protease [Chloroflexota bacterium]|nr:nickel-type superoxide dismutase maturation protease [Chloroflexota bacterium]